MIARGVAGAQPPIPDLLYLSAARFDADDRISVGDSHPQITRRRKTIPPGEEPSSIALNVPG